jgi:hypothetical protein
MAEITIVKVVNGNSGFGNCVWHNDPSKWYKDIEKHRNEAKCEKGKFEVDFFKPISIDENTVCLQGEDAFDENTANGNAS